MKTFLLVVKGTPLDSVRKAQGRGLPLLSYVAYTGSETVLRAQTDRRDIVAGWFVENAECADGFGFPGGTLLHYREVTQ